MQDLLQAVNLNVINFATGSAEIPAEMHHGVIGIRSASVRFNACV